MRVTATSALLATLAVAAAPASAGAATTTSSNWAGYAVRPQSAQTTFRRVAASWTVVRGSCDSNTTGYSATWVGLGGFSRGSRALEQTGTEFDCSETGTPAYYAWYELVPAAGQRIRMTVAPGDAIDAAVTVSGTRVRIVLRDRTRHETFKRSFTMQAPDTSSAEWIVEAPSACDSSGPHCAQLPISNFGTQSFLAAQATTQAGHSGSISDPGWSVTKIVLDQAHIAPRFAAASSARGATPSELSSDGASFSVTYEEKPQAPPGPPTQFPGGAPGPFSPPA